MISSPRKNSTISKRRQRGGHAPKTGRRNTEEEYEEVEEEEARPYVRQEEEARPYVRPSACMHATRELLK